MLEIIGFVFIGLLITFLIYQKARLFYNRYLRTYKKEIREYLNKKGFEHIETIFPNDQEWSNGPFEKPSYEKIVFLYFNIFRIIFCWSDKNYLLIVGQKKDKFHEFWMEVETTYFHKPILTFREGQSIKNNETWNNKEIKIIKVGEKCPACGFKLTNTDKLCPDCGLYFE